MSTKPIQPEERERLARLEAEATPGPWLVKENNGVTSICLQGDFDDIERTPANARLIAELRNAYPALERALQLAEKALEEVVAVDGCTGGTGGAAATIARHALADLGVLPSQEGRE